MTDRRRIRVQRSAKDFLPDRRIRWNDRRRHQGFTRILFFPVADLLSLVLSGSRRPD